ncbi:DUF1799 domain-containing protein, partial [Streptomyces sp. P17]|uniref:DUF1799 domain-containing protein n=1 Tax=Streptomyces sp. P17 TaxID=3074716 RepID=UPI0028F44A82
LNAFLTVATQWRMVAGPTGARAIGLDYAGAKAGLQMSDTPCPPALWSQLRLIERGALAALNEG